MNLTIVFNKEEAENHIRENVDSILKENKMRILAGTLTSKLIKHIFLSTVLAFGTSNILYFCTRIFFDEALLPEGVLFAIISVSFFLMIAGGLIVLYMSEWKDFCVARKAYKKYESSDNAAPSELFDWYFYICHLWADKFKDKALVKSYKNYRSFLVVSNAFLKATYHEDSERIDFTCEKDNGDIYEVSVRADETKENDSIENDTLVWEKGKVVYIKKNHRSLSRNDKG